MKNNSDGQGVIDGVDTDIEYNEKQFKREQRMYAELKTDTMKQFTQMVSTIADMGTYRSIQILDVAMAVMRGYLEIGKKAEFKGSIKVIVRPELTRTQVEASYGNLLFDDNQEKVIGKMTKKPVLYDQEYVSIPRYCPQFDRVVKEKNNQEGD